MHIDRLRRRDKFDGELRRGATQFRKALRQIERGDPLHGGEPHGPDQPLGVAGAGLLTNGDHRALDPLGMTQQALADFVELEPGAVALEHRDPERSLHLGDPPAHGGMVQPQPLCGLTEISGASGTEEDPQIVPVDRIEHGVPPDLRPLSAKQFPFQRADGSDPSQPTLRQFPCMLGRQG